MAPQTRTLVIILVIVAAVALALGVLLGRIFPPAEPAVSPVPTLPASPPPTFLPTPVVSPAPTPVPEGPPRPTVETHRIIQGALNSGDVGTLKTHMAEGVTYSISATECCGILPRGQALAQLQGRLDEAPFDFSPTNPTAQAVRQVATSLQGYAIGTGGGRVLAYRLNARLLIDAVYEADLREFGIPP